MMYPYMTLNDDTEITHLEMKPDGRVKVYIETPVENGFHNATKIWISISGKALLCNNASQIPKKI
ncbi:hypothetical protein NDGK_00286 [Clostridiales bacterium CHKCI001]|nr:hypothetical protein NDGK_00286 [Clostridiales bacterium CHKCI001]